MFGSKKDKKTNLKQTIQRPKFFLKLPNLKFKKITLSILLFCFACTIGFLGIIFSSQYKTDRYKINDLKHVKFETINNILAKYINTPLVRVDTNAIQMEIQTSSIFIDNTNVSKSILDGIVIQIVENNPLIIIKTPDLKSFYIDTNYKIHEIKNSDEVASIQKITFLSNDIQNSNLINYLKKVIRIREKLTTINFDNASFDNFGNLSILIEGEKVIRFDLNERFFAIDEQLRILQDALAKNQNLTQIDLRFSYLLIK